MLSLFRKFKHPTPPAALALRARRRAECKVAAWDLYVRARAGRSLDAIAAEVGRDWWPPCGLIDLDALHEDVCDEFFGVADELPKGAHRAFLAGYFASHPGLVVQAVDRVLERVEAFWVGMGKRLEEANGK